MSLLPQFSLIDLDRRINVTGTTYYLSTSFPIQFCPGCECGWQDFMTVNLVHGQLRQRLLTSEKLRQVEESMGKEATERFVNSGITGVTPGKVGVFAT